MSTPVVLSEFRTDCSCLQIYEKVGETRRRINTMTLRAGESRSVYVDVRISEEPGVSRSSQVSFGVGEVKKSYYTVPILYSPVARLYPMPRIATFGEVASETLATVRVELRSDGTFRERIKAIRCSRPDLFTVTFAEPSASDRGQLAASQPGQFLVGFVELGLKPSDDRTQVAEEVVLFDGNRDLIRIPISATTIPRYRFAPGFVLLPRMAAGQRVYTAKVSCAPRDKKAFELKAVEIDPRFEVKVVADATDPSNVTMQIAFIGEIPTGDNLRVNLAFEAGTSGRKDRLALPVMVMAARNEASSGH